MILPKAMLSSVVFIFVIALLSHRTAASEARAFVARYCVECHDAETKKGGLDLSALSLDLKSPQNFQTWVKVHDRVAAGEMPPKKKPRPKASDLRSFTNSLSSALLKADQERITAEG